MKTICLHNKTGQVTDYKDLVHYDVDGEGDCRNCTFDAQENKNCRKFFPITLTAYEGGNIMGTKQKKFEVEMVWGRDKSVTEIVSFDTQAELDAYLEGVEDMDGWLDYDLNILNEGS